MPCLLPAVCHAASRRARLPAYCCLPDVFAARRAMAACRDTAAAAYYMLPRFAIFMALSPRCRRHDA